MRSKSVKAFKRLKWRERVEWLSELVLLPPRREAHWSGLEAERGTKCNCRNFLLLFSLDLHTEAKNSSCDISRSLWWVRLHFPERGIITSGLVLHNNQRPNAFTVLGFVYWNAYTSPSQQVLHQCTVYPQYLQIKPFCSYAYHQFQCI